MRIQVEGLGIDDTLAVQEAVDSLGLGDCLEFPSDYYLINPAVGIKLGSNKTLDLGRAVLDIGANVPNRARIFETIPGSSNISIYGGTLRGSRVRVAGQQLAYWGIGLRIDTSSHVEVDGTRFEDWWYDGLYCGGNLPGSHDVIIRNVHVTGARRNGMSIATGDLITVERSIFELTTCPEDSNMPQCGLDAEPNKNEGSISRLKLRDNIFRNNGKSGVFIQSPHGVANHNFEVTGNQFIDNTNYGLIINTTEGALVAWNHVQGGKDGYSFGAGAKDLVAFGNTALGQTNRGLVLAAVENPCLIENDLLGGKTSIVAIQWPPLTGPIRNGIFGEVYMRGNR